MTGDYLTTITYREYVAIGGNRLAPIAVLYSGIVLNATEKAVQVYDIDLVLPHHRPAFHALAGLWWVSSGYPRCCGNRHLPISLFSEEMDQFDYALTTLPNPAIINIDGPIYSLYDHFSTGMKRYKTDRSLSPGLTYKPKSRGQRRWHQRPLPISLSPLPSPSESFPSIVVPM
jgi:hypothetical protein